MKTHMKLNHNLLNKLLSFETNELTGRVEKTTCTASELNLMFYLIRMQHDSNFVHNVYYKFACDTIKEKMSYSNFYALLQSLETKGFIKVYDGSTYGYFSIEIIGNSLEEIEQYGYINLNTKVLLAPHFLRLPWGAKSIILRVLQQYREHKTTIRINLETLSKWTGFTLITVKRYLKNHLHKLFQFKVTRNAENKPCIDLDCTVFTQRHYANEDIPMNENFITTTLKRVKKAWKKTFPLASSSDIDNTIHQTLQEVFRQYRKVCERHLIERAVTYCLSVGQFGKAYINTIIKKMRHGTFHEA